MNRKTILKKYGEDNFFSRDSSFNGICLYSMLKTCLESLLEGVKQLMPLLVDSLLLTDFRYKILLLFCEKWLRIICCSLERWISSFSLLEKMYLINSLLKCQRIFFSVFPLNRLVRHVMLLLFPLSYFIISHYEINLIHCTMG